jgi:FtsZ-binding cell division protein ZapB
MWYPFQSLTQKVDKMSQQVDALVAEVARVKTVNQSAKDLLVKLFALVQSAIDTGDMAKVQAAVNDLKAQDDDLAAAVTANTPASP